MKYFKIYHYSPIGSLETIDPAYYGSGVAYFSELRSRPKHTAPYSFYYVIDKPEKVVTEFAAHKYEIYMPYAWKELIYNLNEDPQKFFQQAGIQVAERCHNRSFQISDVVLTFIKESGYKGWTPGYGLLQHALMLFEKLTVEKPQDHSYHVYHYDDETLLESNIVNNSAPRFLFFKNELSSNGTQMDTTIKCGLGMN